VKLTTGGPVPNLQYVSQLENLASKVGQLMIVLFCSTSLLQAKEPTSDPNILCSDPDRKELVLQFQQMNLDVKFVSDFCQRFALNRLDPEQETITKYGMFATKKESSAKTPKASGERQRSAEIFNQQVIEKSEQLPVASVASENTVRSYAFGTEGNDKQEIEMTDANENMLTSQTNLVLEDLPDSQPVTKNQVNNNGSFRESQFVEPDLFSGLIWQLNLGYTKTSFFEDETGTKLKGGQQELRVQKFFTPLVLLGIAQSYRKQQGTLKKLSLIRAIDLEQLQLVGTFGIAWESDNGLGLRSGILGGWSENRLNYRLKESGKTYFSDSIDNGQFIWGFEFGPSLKFMEQWRTGFRWQKQNSRTTVRLAEGNKATLHPLHSYQIWAEYIGEIR
jgi:hypothetical protein